MQLVALVARGNGEVGTEVAMIPHVFEAEEELANGSNGRVQTQTGLVDDVLCGVCARENKLCYVPTGTHVRTCIIHITWLRVSKI